LRLTSIGIVALNKSQSKTLHVMEVADRVRFGHIVAPPQAASVHLNKNVGWDVVGKSGFTEKPNEINALIQPLVEPRGIEPLTSAVRFKNDPIPQILAYSTALYT
jgi:hypothetical protein